jgi:uncharacterized protein (DUF486 family)
MQFKANFFPMQEIWIYLANKIRYFTKSVLIINHLNNKQNTMRAVNTVFLLLGSNVFMTFAWYGHLKLKEFEWAKDWGLGAVILLSWGLAFFEYCLQVPANRIGFIDNGGPYSLIQLKVIQEVVSLSVFVLFSLLIFKNTEFKLNHVASFACLILAVYFAFKK